MHLVSLVTDWLLAAGMSFVDLCVGVAHGLVVWHRSTYQCSRPSHIYLYVLIAVWITLSIGFFFLYRRLFPSKRKSLSHQLQLQP
jgi:hypothetical protein